MKEENQNIEKINEKVKKIDSFKFTTFVLRKLMIKNNLTFLELTKKVISLIKYLTKFFQI